MDDRQGFQRGSVSACFAGGKVPDGATEEGWMRESMLTANGSALANALPPLISDFRGLLVRLSVPALPCYGARSVPFPTNVGGYMRGRIPDSELVVFERSGHSPF